MALNTYIGDREMGYMVSRQTKAELIERIKMDNPTITEWSLVGNHLWGLYPAHKDFTGTDYSFKVGDRLIHLFLLKSFGAGEYGYNCFSESSYPYYYTCPLKFLDKAVVLSPEWRTNVKAYHKTKIERSKALKGIKVGDTITLSNSTVKSVRILQLSPLLGFDEFSNRAYRIPKKMIV